MNLEGRATTVWQDDVVAARDALFTKGIQQDMAALAAGARCPASGRGQSVRLLRRASVPQRLLGEARRLLGRMTMNLAYEHHGQRIGRTEFLCHGLRPRRSVAVEACAGAGKTWMLVSRMLRALLAGAHPQEILAITFTRKAAGRNAPAAWVHGVVGASLFGDAQASELQAWAFRPNRWPVRPLAGLLCALAGEAGQCRSAPSQLVCRLLQRTTGGAATAGFARQLPSRWRMTRKRWMRCGDASRCCPSGTLPAAGFHGSRRHPWAVPIPRRRCCPRWTSGWSLAWPTHTAVDASVRPFGEVPEFAAGTGTRNTSWHCPLAGRVAGGGPCAGSRRHKGFAAKGSELERAVSAHQSQQCLPLC